MLGAVGVWLGFDRADPIAGLVISIAILAVLRTAATEVLRRLMNGVDPTLVDNLERERRAVDGVHGVREVQVRWEGHRLRADLAIEVDPDATVTEGHAIAHDVEHQLLHHIAHLDGAAVHVEPTGDAAVTAHASSHHDVTYGAPPASEPG